MQNRNRHFTLCLQGCDRFHARKTGEPPTQNGGPGFTHLKKKMREGNSVWLEEIQRP
jgi:hypothetical protein